MAPRTIFALALFVGAWTVLHLGPYERDQIVDTPVYEDYGSAIVDERRVPYRDFDVEYPPGALPVFALPAVGDGDYRRAFEWLMLLCGCVAIAGVGIAASRLGLGFPSLALIALSPLALGSVILTRFDLWPAALASLALAALVHDRLKLGHALLGAAVAAKLYPGVFLPLTVAYAWRRRGPRAAFACAVLAVAVVAAAYVPFVLIAPDGVAHSVGRQLSRPLQIESIGAAALLAAHQLFDVQLEMHSSHGSQNLVGTAADVLAVLMSVAQLAVLAWLWLRAARWAHPSPRALVASCAAALVAFVALGKVLSPQFLIWLIPVVPLAASLGANLLVVAALVLTQLWFPFRYWDLVREFDPLVSWLVVARDLVLVALLALLVRRATTRAREPSRSA